MSRTTTRVEYTPPQIAELAKCTRQTIYRHLKEGRFPSARRVGPSKWFVQEDDVISYIGYDPNEVRTELANLNSD